MFRKRDEGLINPYFILCFETTATVSLSRINIHIKYLQNITYHIQILSEFLGLKP